MDRGQPAPGGVPRGKLTLLKSRLKRRKSGRGTRRIPAASSNAGAGTGPVSAPDPTVVVAAAAAAAAPRGSAGAGVSGAARTSMRPQPRQQRQTKPPSHGAHHHHVLPTSDGAGYYGRVAESAPARSAKAVKARQQRDGAEQDTPSMPHLREDVKITQVTKQVVEWGCSVCKKQCIPVREESRCICGHRLKHHPGKTPGKKGNFACKEPRCKCRRFFYVVAEGAWILRCRCKHKHIDHDPSKAKHPCKRERCACQQFDSPWVCNCDHPWAQHKQVFRKKTVFLMNGMPIPSNIAAEMNLVARGGLGGGGAGSAPAGAGGGKGGDAGYQIEEL